jgi:TonB family protein
MSRRDLLYSVIGHALFVTLLFLMTPISGALWGDSKPPPLIFPVGLVSALPEPTPAARRSKPAVNIPDKPPDAAPDDIPVLSPAEKTEKEKLAEKAKPDSLETARQKGGDAEDTTAALAATDTAAGSDRTGEMSHTILDGAQSGGGDDIFGENVPAVGYGATDPYFQSLFLTIQRAFRNPVPGYKPVRCVVIFTVMNTGEIKDLKLETSSGIPRFDRAALRAVERVEWGRRFPDKFSDYDGYHIRMPFEYVPR